MGQFLFHSDHDQHGARTGSRMAMRRMWIAAADLSFMRLGQGMQCWFGLPIGLLLAVFAPRRREATAWPALPGCNASAVIASLEFAATRPATAVRCVLCRRHLWQCSSWDGLFQFILQWRNAHSGQHMQWQRHMRPRNARKAARRYLFRQRLRHILLRQFAFG